MIRLLVWLFGDRLIQRSLRTPFTHIRGSDGSIYMLRFWLVPFRETERCGWRRPIGWLLQRFDVAVRVHHIQRADRAPHLHDHPWNWCSVVLAGGYLEALPLSPHATCFVQDACVEHCINHWRWKGSIAFKRFSDRHSIVNVSAGGAWTLFITTGYRNKWGFFTPGGKVAYMEYEQLNVVE